MADRRYLFITPHGRRLCAKRGWSTRPAQLAVALATHATVSILARTHPLSTLAAAGHLRPAGPWPWPVFSTREPVKHEPRLLEHPFPSGRLESALVSAVIRSLARETRGSVRPAVVVSDPRSAGVLRGLTGASRLFDAYDAWDLSPLYNDSPRVVKAIQMGYVAAARHADLVTANTSYMADRLRQLGARRVELLPNGAPSWHARPGLGSEVIYIGNIQPRLRVDLMVSAAEAALEAGTVLRIIGDVQRAPPGWKDLLSHPAVRFAGPRFGGALDAAIGQAAVGLVPHAVDAYTRSQDAMKVWDYLAHGLSVVSASVPPASDDASLARLADEPRDFHAAVVAALREDRGDQRRRAQELTEANGWDRRARRLADLIDQL